jgi:hypothetical protein
LGPGDEGDGDRFEFELEGSGPLGVTAREGSLVYLVVQFPGFNVIQTFFFFVTDAPSKYACYRKRYFIKNIFCKFDQRKLTVFSSTQCLIKLVTLNYLLYMVSIFN